MDRQPGHLTPARGDASPAGLSHRPTPRISPPVRRRAGAAAFTLIEILIVVVIMGILAAIVVPQFSNASHVARENMLKDELRYLRTQINVYKAQHGDVPPGYTGGVMSNDNPNFDAFRTQMLNRTNARGENGLDSKLYPFGPYLQRIPLNPLTQSGDIRVLKRGESIPKWNQITDSDQKTYGWIYKPDTQEIVACSKEQDGRKRPYIEY
jgi:general secretion pathway protein G